MLYRFWISMSNPAGRSRSHFWRVLPLESRCYEHEIPFSSDKENTELKVTSNGVYYARVWTRFTGWPPIRRESMKAENASPTFAGTTIFCSLGSNSRRASSQSGCKCKESSSTSSSGSSSVLMLLNCLRMLCHFTRLSLLRGTDEISCVRWTMVSSSTTEETGTIALQICDAKAICQSSWVPLADRRNGDLLARRDPMSPISMVMEYLWNFNTAP